MGFLYSKILAKKVILFSVILLICLTLVFGLNPYPKEKSPTKTAAAPFSIPGEFNYWDTEIKNSGAETAYGHFKDKYLKQYPANIHYVTHIFGEVLYKNEGVKGIKVCDSNFAYGCYHGFIITAIEEKGLDIIPDINQACIENDGVYETGCRHGIGHGLVEYLGRNEDDIKKALEICNSIQRVNPLGCTQGVFMEYNKPGIMGTSEQTFMDVRKLEGEEKLHEPCRSLSGKFQVSCYYEQSQWWVDVLNNDFKRTGELCNSLSTEKMRLACSMGLGVAVAQRTNYKPEGTASACDQFPTSEERVYCRAGASWVFKSNPNHAKSAHLLCQGISQVDAKKCTDKAISPRIVF